MKESRKYLAIGWTDEQARGQRAMRRAWLAPSTRRRVSDGAGRAANGRASRRVGSSAAGQRGIDAHRTCAVAGQEQEDQGVEQWQLAAILYGPPTARGVHHEERGQHLQRQ